MSLISTLRHFANDWQVARAEIRTRRIIASLPMEVQKDIGWPDTGRRQRLPLGLGSWAGEK
jgi:hypothetical protein